MQEVQRSDSYLTKRIDISDSLQLMSLHRAEQRTLQEGETMSVVGAQKTLMTLLLTGIIATCFDPAQAQATTPATITPEALGITFLDKSGSQFVVERDGKKYLIDVATHAVQTLQEPDTGGVSSSRPSVRVATANALDDQQADSKSKPVYRTGDDLVFSVPTGRRLERHGLYINFTHRFPYESAFKGPARGATLLGLDDFSVSSFGFRYGLTSKLFVMAYRSPSIIGRPLEFMGGYSFLDEKSGDPLNMSFRFSIDGQDNFSRNFTENFEFTASRSLGRRAQLYAVPTFSIHNRPILGATSSLTDPPPFQPCGQTSANAIDPSLRVKPCANTVSLGLAVAVDVRPTVALVAEGIPTLLNGRDLGIHRPAYSFGIQKKLWRHAFTFGFTNSPGTTVAQRAGTNATYLRNPSADKPSGMFVGFDLTRQAF